MNLIQALRLPNSQAVMTNIARFHYQNIYNVGLTPPIFTQSNLTFQIKGYTRNYRFLRLDYACVIYIADRIAVVASNGIDTLSSGFRGVIWPVLGTMALGMLLIFQRLTIVLKHHGIGRLKIE